MQFNSHQFIERKVFPRNSQNGMYVILAICHSWLPRLLIIDLSLRNSLKAVLPLISCHFLFSQQREMGMRKQRRVWLFNLSLKIGPFQLSMCFIWTQRMNSRHPNIMYIYQKYSHQRTFFFFFEAFFLKNNLKTTNTQAYRRINTQSKFIALGAFKKVLRLLKKTMLSTVERTRRIQVQCQLCV